MAKLLEAKVEVAAAVEAVQRENNSLWDKLRALQQQSALDPVIMAVAPPALSVLLPKAHPVAGAQQPQAAPQGAPQGAFAASPMPAKLTTPPAPADTTPSTPLTPATPATPANVVEEFLASSGASVPADLQARREP